MALLKALSNQRISQVAAQVIVSLAVGLVLQGVLDPHGADWEKTARESMQILMNGLAKYRCRKSRGDHKMNDLVTGATGHIGNVLVRKLLDQGEKVRALIWRGEDTTPLKGLDVEQVEGDVLDPASLEPAMHGVETVYHLAGIISIMPGRNPLVWRVNVEGTRNVLEAARHARVRRLIYTSSIHAIARAPHGCDDGRIAWVRSEQPLRRV